jgi:hypothetical protein
MDDDLSRLEQWTRLKKIDQAYSDATGWRAVKGIDYWQKVASVGDPVEVEVHFADGHTSVGFLPALEHLRRMCEAADVHLRWVPAGE